MFGAWTGFGFGASGGIGARIVESAQRYVGQTEIGGNNRGAIVQTSLRGTGHSEGVPWCAGFATNCINEGARGVFGRDMVQTTAGVAASMADYRRAGAFSAFNGSFDGVRPGDAVFFRRYAGGLQVGGHMGVISSVGDGRIGIIEGNVSVAGGNQDGRGNDGVRSGTFSVDDLRARNIVGFGHNETRAMAMGPATMQGMNVASTNLGGFSPMSVPNNAYTNDPARTFS